MRLIVNPHKVDIIKDELVNEREIDISKCTFEFAEEITQEYVKEAYFTYNGETYKQIINNNECAFPSEVLEQKGMVEIGVVAYLVQNEQEIKRYNPSPAYFNTIIGSLKDNAKNSEQITPSEMEQFEQQLQNGLNSIDDKLDEVDTKMETVDTKIDEIDTAIEETNNLDLDVNKQDNKTTVTLTKKNGSTKSVDVLDGTDGQDGTSLEFMWQGTSLGIKTDDMQDYVFVDLQGVQGPIGETGEPFTIKKTYSSIAEMNADFDNMELGDYVMIASSVEIEDNAKLFTKGESAWIFITDFSGAMGIRGETGLTPNIQIGTVVTGETSNVTRTGTNENPILNFVLEKGEKGETGSTGPQGETGNGIASVTKTSTSGLTDTYTITYTNGNTSTFNITNGEDGEVTQEQLDQVIKDLEYWKTTNNALPKVEAEGTDITLNDTADSPLTLEFKVSESIQNSTRGINILPLIEGTTINNLGLTIEVKNGKLVINGTTTRIIYGNTSIWNSFKFSLKAGTYTFSRNNTTYSSMIYDLDSNTVLISLSSQSTVNTITIDNDLDNLMFGMYIPANTTINNYVCEVQLENGTTQTDWEPYTGNQPTPNPDYPQDIHIVKDDNEVVIENKNLYSYNSTQTVNGITLTNNDNKSIDLSGTNTGARFNFSIRNIPIEDIDRTKTYKFISNMPTNKFSLSIAEYNGTTWVRTLGSLNEGKNEIEVTPSSDISITKIGIALFIDANATLNISNLRFAFVEKIQKYPLSLGVENLANLSVLNSVPATTNGEMVTFNGAASTDFIQIDNSKSYIFSFEYTTESTTQRYIMFYDENKNYLGYHISISNGYILNNSQYYSSSKYVKLRVDRLSFIKWLQLEEGNKAHSYSPYGQTPIEMCNINNNADEFFKNVPECEYYDNTLEEGKWYKLGKIGKVVLDGSEDVTNFGSSTYEFRVSPVNTSIKNNSAVLCNKLQPSNANDMWNVRNTSGYNLICATTLNSFLVMTNNQTTVGGIKSELSNGYLVYYVLATPTKTLLSDTLQEQLDSISYAMAYQDQTNISQANEDRPFVISASTLKDIKTLENRITAIEQSISL